MTKRLTAVIHREGNGFVALCPELDIASQGDTIEAARDYWLSRVEKLEAILELQAKPQLPQISLQPLQPKSQASSSNAVF